MLWIQTINVLNVKSIKTGCVNIQINVDCTYSLIKPFQYNVCLSLQVLEGIDDSYWPLHWLCFNKVMRY